MAFLIRNTYLAVSLALTALRFAGFWTPGALIKGQTLLYNFYGFFVFMFLLGVYLTIQVVDLYFIWGNIPLMTGAAFLLFTNLAQALKIFNILYRRKWIQAIIDDCDDVLQAEKTVVGRGIIKSCNREMSLLLLLYCSLTLTTTIGWASSAENNKLPLQAWYPYDTSKSPAFQLTYTHQVCALCAVALLNVCKDTLVVALVAQCRCRLQLLCYKLRSLCDDLPDKDHFIAGKSHIKRTKPLVPQVTDKVVTGIFMLTPKQEKVVKDRLRLYVHEHQRTLETVVQLQRCFSEPTFVQFMVSLIIICVTAFQLISQTSNLVRFLSMGTYLLNMMFQVFLYCYQGSQLTEESTLVADAAHACPWYRCGRETRRSLLILMTRCQRAASITAGGFTPLSLVSFMAVIKTSYSLFTLLNDVDEKH